MNVRNTLLIFGISIIVTNMAISLYGAVVLEVMFGSVLVFSIINGSLLAIPGGVGYFYGLKISKSNPKITRIFFNGTFSFMFAYSISTVFGLSNVHWFMSVSMSVSWFIFAILVGMASFITGWRLSSVRPKKVSA